MTAPAGLVTRFAPSPTGPLHLGHAFSAMLAHDMARAAGGTFLLRMEDIDRARSRPHWAAQIEDDLAWLGLSWDGPVSRQSTRTDRYDAALAKLAGAGLVYPCRCSRADIRAALDAPQEGAAAPVYPGICRGRPMADAGQSDATRLNLAAALATLDPAGLNFTETGEAHAGTHTVDAARLVGGIGDPVLNRRGDAAVAFALASALDDAEAGITHVIRGLDLFEFTAIQIVLQRLLGLPTPTYRHHRLIRDEAGRRLAKRDDARAIAAYREAGATPADLRRLTGLPPAPAP